MTKYGRSPWPERVARSRVPSYPRQRTPLVTDVAIIGGGLTGCATAYALAAAGIKVVLVEASAIGHGSTASSSGWISDDPGVTYLALDDALGRRAARHVFQSWRRAALDFGALVRRLEIKADFEERGSLVLAQGPEQAARLKREQKGRKDAGIETSVVNARSIASDAAVTGTAAFRSHEGATLDPYRTALALASAAEARGAHLFEKTPAKKVKFGRKGVEVTTAGGTIKAGRVVVATGRPTPLFHALVRHFWFNTTYLALTEPIAAKVRRQLGPQTMVLRDMQEPSHVIRWVDQDRLLVAGADSESPSERLREKTLVQRTGQLMYELSVLYPDISGIAPAYGWDCAYARTADGLPFIGPHRNYPFHLFAFGDSSHSVTGAYLASRILLRQVLDEADAADEAFGFNRYGHVR